MGLWTWLTGGVVPTNRKYIDLIYTKSSWYATYSPFQANEIQVGDYGVLDKKTGEFDFQGNIYTDDEILAAVPELAEPQCKPISGEPILKWVITANVTKEAQATVSPNANFMGVVDAAIDIEITFHEKKRGAYLAMHQAQTKELPKNIILDKLSRVRKLQQGHRHLVTRVVQCPAYALHLSDQGSRAARIKFQGSLPVHPVPGLTAGGAIGVGWRNEQSGSSYHEGCNTEGKFVYRPLYYLQKIRPEATSRSRGAGRPAERTGDDTWMEALPPWGELDENGVEVHDEDDDDDEDAGVLQNILQKLRKSSLYGPIGMMALVACLTAVGLAISM